MTAGGEGGDHGDGNEDGGAAGSTGEAGIGAAGGAEPACDATKTPRADACVIDEEYGVFVSAAGDDETGNGSRSKPFAKLATAIDDAIASHKRVYACADAGPYEESVALEPKASGLEIYGGFSCKDWSYSSSTQSRLLGSTALALRITDVKRLRVEDLRIDGAGAATPGESSIGVLVASSSDVLFRRVRIAAAAGMAGANGTREDFEFPARENFDGNSTNSETAAPPRVCECPGGAITAGGSGGNASLGGQAGGNGFPDYQVVGGEGGMPGSCTIGVGRDGVNAPAMTPSAGAANLGILSAKGWTPASGNDGAPGSPGQGGGGGASSATGGGGGGGCGSCGGAGGKGGRGGGGSIALAVFESVVTLENADLLSAHGGAGGSGTGGQAPQAEAGYPGRGTLNGCQGGAGGLGAAGGASGGGAGGISAGIIWKGVAPPTKIKVNINIGAPGAGGVGGKPGVNDGIVGDAQDVIEAP